MPDASISVPTKVELAPRLVAAVGVHHTSQADAPLASVTTELADDVSAPSILNMYVPAPFKVTVPPPPMLAAPDTQYTPGVYTPTGPCVVSVARSIGPGAKLNEQGWLFKLDSALFWSMPAWLYTLSALWVPPFTVGAVAGGTVYPRLPFSVVPLAELL